ncbi:hypothetical protein ABIE16_002052 [Pseudomonas sp. 2725]
MKARAWFQTTKVGVQASQPVAIAPSAMETSNGRQ